MMTGRRPGWLNSVDRFGMLAIIFHWLMAAAIIGLFVLGLWMVDLDYYHPWYNRGPDIHRSVGMLVFLLLVLRLLLRLLNPPPGPVPELRPWERAASRLTHRAMYILILLVVVCGYLISSADGRSVSVFGWLQVPATITGIPAQEEVAGELHYWLAVLLISLASVHAVAALKHHFIDRDATLRRMLGMAGTADPTRERK